MGSKISSVLLLICLLSFAGTTVAWGQAPSLALKDSIPAAEKALTDAGIDVASYYLYSIVFTNSSKGSYWYYTFRATEASQYNQYFVKVYMSGEAEVIGALAPKARR